MSKDHTILEANIYLKSQLKFYLKCEEVAAQLEITVDHLLAEFYVDGQLSVPDYVKE